MRTFVELLKKPSAAVQAMIDGLLALDEEPGIEIDMEYYCGKNLNSRCMVCAATAAAMQATQTPVEALVEYMDLREESLDDWAVLSEVMNCSWEDVMGFETAMNTFRLGVTEVLLAYFGVGFDHPAYGTAPGFALHNENWRGQLPAVEAYRDKLIELGL